MIDIHDINHLWRCSPAILYNEKGGLVVNIRLASLPDLQARVIAESNLGPEAINKAADEFVDARVDSFENLKIGGKDITTFKELLATGTYQELVFWCRAAVQTEAWLSLAEIKNSSPGSASDSIADQKPARKTRSRAKTASPAKKKRGTATTEKATPTP